MERKCQSLRDQARLKAIAPPYLGGWLKAIPEHSVYSCNVVCVLSVDYVN